MWYFYFSEFSFLLNVLQKRLSQKDQSPCHHHRFFSQILRHQILLSLLPLLLLSWGSSAEGAGPPARAGPPVPTLQMRLPMLMWARSFANKPGQKRSTFIPAASMRALILPSFTVSSHLAGEGLSRHKRAQSQTQGRVPASAGRVRASTTGCGASSQMNWGPWIEHLSGGWGKPQNILY